ncbi:MAG: flagellar P-ring protein [Candidatus Hydrogenedentota bacterium]
MLRTTKLVSRLAILCLCAAAWGSSAWAARVKDLCEIQGARPNALRGIGLIVGLAGTGDKAKDAVARQARLLERLDIDVLDPKALTSDNVAVVWVDATFPAFGKEGTRIDVRVSSIYDAESLEGGTLLPTYLQGEDGEIYAVAQGPVSVGGFAAGGGGAQVTQNHVTAGRVPMGGSIEREIPSTITDGERITLLLKRADFATANAIREALDSSFGAGTGHATTAAAINVRIPSAHKANLIGFISEVQALNVKADVPSRVVINERTGTLVVGGEVIIKPCQVAHGNLTIRVEVTPLVSQPEPFSEGETVTGESGEVDTIIEEGSLMPVQGTSASDVAEALNRLKVTPRDMISIFQAIRAVGALDADLEIM